MSQMPLSEQFTNLRINPGKMASRPTLSVDDLSNAGAEPSKMISEIYYKNDQASFLVKALKDFILPIIQMQAPELATNQSSNANDDIKRPHLELAAQKLIDALESFISFFLSPHLAHQDGTQAMEVRNVRDNRELIEYIERTGGKSQSIPRKSQSKGGLKSVITPAQPRLLKLALELGHNRVFNKMPIRLLAFQSDGSGIDILDRSTIWDRISTLIEANFNEDQLNIDIMRRSGPDAERETIEDFVARYARYAILSHCWLYEKPGEVTYSDWKSEDLDINSPGYQKLSNFCKVAAEEHGTNFAWMDTVCINKDSSAELDESIRSMFKWYRDAAICITYLAHSATRDDMRHDTWFSRGWTLQELLAPRNIKFYGADWQQLVLGSLNDKEDPFVQVEITAATSITSDELNMTLTNIHISRRMQWAAKREVTREEDTAYSLMGIFDVSISIAYGEGAERAFFRLVQQILNSGRHAAVQDIINWGYGPAVTPSNGSQSQSHVSLLIPSSPQQYLWRTASPIVWPPPSIPVTLTHLGLHLSVLLMPASLADPTSQPFYPIGNYYGNITIDEAAVFDLVTGSQRLFSPGYYNILDSMTGRYNSRVAGYPHHHSITLGVLNFTTTEEQVSFRLTSDGMMRCFAICLYFGNNNPADVAAIKAASVIRTPTSIVFDLHQLRPTVLNAMYQWHIIPKTNLARHGMQLLDMYL